MRASLWFCSMLAGACLLGGQKQELDPCSLTSSDPYCFGNVTSAFEMCKHGTGMFSSMSTGIAQLGDRVSIGAVKQWDADELAASENTRAYLCLVRMAFSNPVKISRNADRNPNVTLLLLNYLQIKEAHDVDMEKEIESAKRYVKEKVSASSPSGEDPSD
jgi:hypothetical protein